MENGGHVLLLVDDAGQDSSGWRDGQQLLAAGWRVTALCSTRGAMAAAPVAAPRADGLDLLMLPLELDNLPRLRSLVADTVARLQPHEVRDHSDWALAAGVLQDLTSAGVRVVHPAVPAAAAPARIVWEGSQFVVHSMGQTNRELSLELLDLGHELSLLPYEPDEFGPDADPRFARLVARQRAVLGGPVDVHVRHMWPPDFRRPAAGKLVLFQPWEFGALPEEWLLGIEGVDEVWVPTSFVRDGYVRSGVEEAKVHVVPNGVRPQVFHPGAAAVALPTRKRFRFLFVGGTIPRKGIDLLLAAWLRAFTARDDVTLVIKDICTQGAYRGKTAGDLIARARATPGAPEIVYLDQTLSAADMAGLYTACDCLVHPYRGEGFGMPIAEAMACGRPTIVTGYGAALDFCDASTSWLIPATVTRIRHRRIHDLTLCQDPWLAEPDVEVLIELLRHATAQAEELRAKGRAAARRILGGFTWRHAAQAAARRVAALIAQG